MRMEEGQREEQTTSGNFSKIYNDERGGFWMALGYLCCGFNQGIVNNILGTEADLTMEVDQPNQVHGMDSGREVSGGVTTQEKDPVVERPSIEEVVLPSESLEPEGVVEEEVQEEVPAVVVADPAQATHYPEENSAGNIAPEELPAPGEGQGYRVEEGGSVVSPEDGSSTPHTQQGGGWKSRCFPMFVCSGGMRR